MSSMHKTPEEGSPLPYQMVQVAVTSVSKDTVKLTHGSGPATIGSIVDRMIVEQRGTPQEVRVKIGKMKYPGS